MTVTLTSETVAVRGELARVDAKAGTLTGLAGAALAFIASQAGHGPAIVQAAHVAAGVAFAVAVLLLIDVLRPRLGQIGFCRYAAMKPADITRYFTIVAPDDITAEDLHILSVIAARKFRRLAYASYVMAAGVVLLFVQVIA